MGTNHIHGFIGVFTLDYGLKPVGTCHGMSLTNRAKFGKPQAESLSIILYFIMILSQILTDMIFK